MIAIIDIGTNTFHLNIAEVLPNEQIQFHYKAYDPVKLGEGGINEGFITDEAFERGVSALVKYTNIIKNFPVKFIQAIATSAVRDARNSQLFIDEVKRQTDIEINVINGNDEAEYIYEGARAAIAFKNKTNLIVDIGGGSVEFIICNDKEIFWKESFNVGVARLMEFYMIDRKLSKKKRKELNTFLKLQLKTLFDACILFNPTILIGTAGSFETYAEVLSLNDKQKYDVEQMTFFKFKYKQLVSLLKYLKNSTSEDRENMKGIIPFRVDMIVIAAALTHLILKETKIKKVKLSSYALKEGAILKFSKANYHTY